MPIAPSPMQWQSRRPSSFHVGEAGSKLGVRYEGPKKHRNPNLPVNHGRIMKAVQDGVNEMIGSCAIGRGRGTWQSSMFSAPARL